MALLALFGLPWFPGLTHWDRHGSVSHPFVSLIVLSLVLLLVARAFRRKPS